MLIGNSDSPAPVTDGKLRVTLHHNEFSDLGQRAPRVRFGKVDAYNNHYIGPQATPTSTSTPGASAWSPIWSPNTTR